VQIVANLSALVLQTPNKASVQFIPAIAATALTTQMPRERENEREFAQLKRKKDFFWPER
jgi:hypothetical protein